MTLNINSSFYAPSAIIFNGIVSFSRLNKHDFSLNLDNQYLKSINYFDNNPIFLN